jgi:hypothetical protein
MNNLISLALRRITGQGSSVDSSNGSSPTSTISFFANRSSQHTLAMEYDGLPSWEDSLDGAINSFVSSSQLTGSRAVFNMGSVSGGLPEPKVMKPHLSLLTEIGRKYPGFPTPLSPTSNAKELFPSPVSDFSGMPGTPRALSPAMRSVSPMSIDGSEMCGPSRRCESHGFGRYSCQMSSIDDVLTGQIREDVRTPSASQRSITRVASPSESSSCCVSPRIAMLTKTTGHQNTQELRSSEATVNSGPKLQFLSDACNLKAYLASPAPSIRSHSIAHTYPSLPPPVPIANGIEFETVSPLDPTGTMLMYTSSRSVDSGLLGVSPLSEQQVAEYRFWRPCGRRDCGFGCGGADVGEAAAAKRLFRDVEDVNLERIEEHDEEQNATMKKQKNKKNKKQSEVCEYSLDGQIDAGADDEGRGNGKQESPKSSVWAGRRLVTDWGSFLKGCEREGIARF